jgi:hypothetical protein
MSMIWMFKKSKPSSNDQQSLVFKSSEAFFESQCKYGDTDIVPKKGIVAIVTDTKKDFGTKDSVKIQKDGTQLAMLKVVSDDGGFPVVAQTPLAGGDRLKPKDLVIWVPVTWNKEIVPADVDERFGWVGYIVAKLKPELDMRNNGFKIICHYTQ